MKRLTERTEIASAINFRKYPVIEVDVSKGDDYGIKGTKVLIDNGTFKSGEPYFVKATLRTYNDENVLKFSAHGACLKADFGYSDIEKMLEYANAPIIKANQDILVVLIDRERRIAYAPVVLRTGSRVDANCITPLTLERFEVI